MGRAIQTRQIVPMGFIALVACGNSVPSVTQPTPSSFSKTPESATYAAPFLIHPSKLDVFRWKSAMQGTVAVVSYDGNDLSLLEGCTASGFYFSRSVRAEEGVAGLLGREEIFLNIPGSRTWPDMVHGVLDDPLTLGFVILGEYANMRRHLSREELVGACDGATHFVRKIDLGEYAMVFGHADRFASLRDVFEEAGALETWNRCQDGRFKAGGLIPGSDCNSPIRMHLVALGEKPSGIDEQAIQPNPCPLSSYVHGHHCAFGKPGSPHLCVVGDVDDCLLQCGLGHGSSCNQLGWMYENGIGVEVDGRAARRVYGSACEWGEARGCMNLGRIFESELLPASAARVFDAACDQGNGLACARLSALYAMGKGVEHRCDRAENLMQRACRFGVGTACTRAARADGPLASCAPVSLVHRESFLSAGCAGADLEACTLLAKGWMWEGCENSRRPRRSSRQQKVRRAKELLDAACSLQHEPACELSSQLRSFDKFPATPGPNGPNPCSPFETDVHQPESSESSDGIESP